MMIHKPPRPSKAKPRTPLGTHHIGAYFPAPYKANMKRLEAETGKNMRELLGEMIREWSARHKLPKID